jgi:RNA polymerase sigma-70 factor, ECF subfamily
MESVQSGSSVLTENILQRESSGMRPEFIRAVDLLRQNTPDSISEAIGLLQNAVYSFSMKVCGHREDAEDTAQEVLLRSLKHLSKLQEPAGLAAWLYTVARNRCSRVRSRVQESPARRVSLDELMPEEWEIKQLLLDSSESPEYTALNGEQRKLLHRAVLSIPPQLRIVLVLHDMEELSTEQVAQILNLKEGSVRVRLHRARLALRKEMFLALKRGRVAGSGESPSTTRPSVTKAPERKPKECRELFASLSEYLDHRITPKKAKLMKGHIAECPACVAFMRDLRAAIDRCRGFHAACDPAIASRLQALLTEEYLRLTKSSLEQQLPIQRKSSRL